VAPRPFTKGWSVRIWARRKFCKTLHYIKSWMDIDPGRPPERNPKSLVFALFMAFSVTSTAVGLLGLPPSLSRVPYLMAIAALAVLLIGCLASAVGMVLRDRDTGMGIELGGECFQAVGLSFYATAVVLMNTWTVAAVAAGLSIGIALGCMARVVQIGLYVHRRKAATPREEQKGLQ
jgi:4-amino-4-deoxy-L-arabinose transferase-like glycosyltransferase